MKRLPPQVELRRRTRFRDKPQEASFVERPYRQTFGGNVPDTFHQQLLFTHQLVFSRHWSCAPPGLWRRAVVLSVLTQRSNAHPERQQSRAGFLRSIATLVSDRTRGHFFLTSSVLSELGAGADRDSSSATVAQALVEDGECRGWLQLPFSCKSNCVSRRPLNVPMAQVGKLFKPFESILHSILHSSHAKAKQSSGSGEK